MSKPSLEEIKQDMEQKRRAAAAAAAYVAYDDAATYADAIAAADVYYECCDEHEVSYMGACGMCLTEEINEMIADPKAISLVDKDFLKAVLSFIPAPTTSSEYQGVKIVEDHSLKDDEFKMVSTSSGPSEAQVARWFGESTIEYHLTEDGQHIADRVNYIAQQAWKAALEAANE